MARSSVMTWGAFELILCFGLTILLVIIMLYSLPRLSALEYVFGAIMCFYVSFLSVREIEQHFKGA